MCSIILADYQLPLLIVAALGSGLMAGTLFAFSVFVMRALERLPAEQGIAAMQSINAVVLNGVFLGVFLGPSVVCALLAVMAVLGWQSPAAGWRLAGALLYIVGCCAVAWHSTYP